MDLSYLTDGNIDEVVMDFSVYFRYIRERKEKLLKDGRITYEESLFLEKSVTLEDKDEVFYVLNKSREMLEEIREVFRELGYRIHGFRQDPYQNLF